MPKIITLRRVILLIVGAILPFLLTVFGSYIVQAHTKDGKLAMWVILHSQTMTDQQLAQAIGQDPFAVIRRAALLMEAINPIAAISVGILIAFFERRVPARMVALALTPFFMWDFSMSAFSTALNPLQTMDHVTKTIGTSAACMAMALLAAIAIARLLSIRKPIPT